MALVVQRHLDRRPDDSEQSPAELGVILLHLGGPDSLEEIESYHLERWSHESTRGRAKQAYEQARSELRMGYERIGGRSPVNEFVRHQALALENRLCGRPAMSAGGPGRFRVLAGFRFGRPRIDEVVERARQLGLRRLIAIPLYPLETVSASGPCLDDFRRATDQAGLGEISRVIRSFADRPEFLSAVAVRLHRALDLVADEFREQTRVLLSFGSAPPSPAKVNPYLAQVEQVAQAVLARAGLPESRCLVGFANSGGPGPWLEPTTADLAMEQVQQGLTSLLILPLGQVTDDFHTLHELDGRLMAELHTQGIQKYRRAPVFNADPALIDLLAQLVREQL